MSNPIIYYTNPASASYTGSVQTASGYPWSNLSDYDVQTVWSSSDNSSKQYLQVDLGPISQSCNAIIVDNHNWYSAIGGNSFNISGSNSPTFNTLVYSSSISYLTDLTSNNTWYWPLPAVTARYWRFDFADIVNVAPYAGNVWIPQNTFTFESPYLWGNTKEDAQYDTVKKRNLKGTIVSTQMYKGKIVYQLQFTLQSNTAKSNFQQFHRSVRGTLFPFYFLDVDGYIRYMHIDDYVPVMGLRFNKNNIQALNMITDQGSF